MKQNNLNIDFNSKPNEKPKGINIPQSTKYSGHSKIKGFSFHLESGLSKDGMSNLDQQNQSKSNDKDKENNQSQSQNCKIEEASQSKGHKSKISYQNPPISGMNLSKNESKKEESKEEPSEKKITGVNGNITIDTPLNITDLIKDQNFCNLNKNILNLNFEKYESTRYSTKSLNLIKSFAANTHQGVVRKYNEDRVSIILNIVKPSSFKGSYWPVCSFFGVFDGHGGNKCADYLKDNLHNFVSS